MTVSGPFKPRSLDVAWEQFDNDAVVLDLESGAYFSLADGAALVWQALMQGHAVEALCASVPANSQTQAEIAGLVQQFQEHHLVVPVPGSESVAPTSPLPDLSGLTGTFRFDMFNDLADLLLADPIHGVDPSTGWPVLPKTGD
jgi:hypothetical protein